MSEVAAKRAHALLEIARLRGEAGTPAAGPVDVRAPVAGMAAQVFVSGPGVTLAPGAAVAAIVPASNRTAIDIDVPASQRQLVAPGMQVLVKLAAYDISIYGRLKAVVRQIAAVPGAGHDGQPPAYRVRLEADASSLGPANPVVPGMAASVDLAARPHTVLDLLLVPLNRLRQAG